MDTSQTGGQYLGNELSINKNITIGATSEEISVPKKRISYSIKNTSVGAQIVSIVLNNNEVAEDGKGIVLNPNEAFIDSNSEGYLCWTGSIRAISSGAGATIAIMERSN